MRVGCPRVTHPFATLLGPIAEAVLVRLACVRRAASVDSEPGSNSRLKPVCPSALTQKDPKCESVARLHLEDESYCTYTLNQIVKELVLSGTLLSYPRKAPLSTRVSHQEGRKVSRQVAKGANEGLSWRSLRLRAFARDSSGLRPVFVRAFVRTFVRPGGN